MKSIEIVGKNKRNIKMQASQEETQIRRKMSKLKVVEEDNKRARFCSC